MDPSGREATVAGLADALIEAERAIVERRPARVVLGDSSDLALAAAIAATKLNVPVAATAAAREPSTSNGLLISQLAADLDSTR